MKKILESHRNHQYSDYADKLSAIIPIYLKKSGSDYEFISDNSKGIAFRSDQL